MISRAIFFSTALAAASASAATPAYTGKMCTGWSAGTCAGGFATQTFPHHLYSIDRKNRVYLPTGTPRHQLLVYLHGCCTAAGGDATADGDRNLRGFISQAVADGYHVISLDYNNTDVSPWGGAAITAGGSNDGLCGCDKDCYGWFYRYLWKAEWHNGLGKGAHMPVEESIENRLLSVLVWLLNNSQTSSSGANDTPADWQGFLLANSCGPSCFAVDYSKMVMSGDSLGSDVSGYIAKHVAISRAILLVGIGDNLDHDPPLDGYYDTTNNWDLTLGAVPSCAKQFQPPQTSAWVADNRWSDPSGTVWANPLDHIYSLRGKCDTTAVNADLPDTAPYHASTVKAWDTITLGTLHQGTGNCAVDGYGDVELFSSPWCHRHGLSIGGIMANGICGGICTGGHSSVLGIGGSCDDTTQALPSKLTAVWHYMLTN